MNVAHPAPAFVGRRADPRVARIPGVTQGVHIGPILIDPGLHLIGSSDRSVPGDDDIDVGGRALEQLQRDEVVLERVSGVARVEHRNQDIGKHVPRDKNSSFFDHQRRMARGVRPMLDDPHGRAVPGNLHGTGGQAGDEAEQGQRHLIGDAEPT